MKLAGKRAVITGASQGLGRNIAARYAQEGCDIVICSRSQEDILSAREEIGHGRHTKVISAVADISVQGDIEKLVSVTEEQLGGLDVLVCNAGVYGPKGSLDELDWQSWVDAIQINLLGTVLCCRLFLPLLRSGKSGKIILLSGGGATKPMPNLSAYAASKAAVVRFGETLAEELRDSGIDVNSVAPGALNTRLLQEVLNAGPEKVGSAFYQASLKQQDNGGTPLDVASALCVYLASDESNGVTGKLISAVWDPWKQFADYKDDLNRTDVYTLRRIIPADRDLAWGK